MTYYHNIFSIKKECIINFKIIDYDLCGKNIDDYKDCKRPIEYLGYGKIYSIDDIKQNSIFNYHFWRFK